MENEKNAAFPALYTSDPDALVDALWARLQGKIESMQAGNETWLTIADVGAAVAVFNRPCANAD